MKVLICVILGCISCEKMGVKDWSWEPVFKKKKKRGRERNKSVRISLEVHQKEI